jgi:PmbA protein
MSSVTTGRAADPLALAERALAAVSAADSAQATVTAERSLLLRFAASRPTQSTAIDDIDVEITVVRDGHVGAAATNRAEPDALSDTARAAERAAEAAARAAGGPGPYPGPAEPEPLRGHLGFDPVTARLDPAGGGAALAATFAAAQRHGVEVHGTWTAADMTIAIAATTGLAATDRMTDAFMKVIARAPGGRTGYASSTAPGVAAIDATALTERAAAKASVPGELTRLPPGDYPVVLEALAVGELLDWVGGLALNGLAALEGRSALEGRLRTRVAPPIVNLSDSPRLPGTLARAFDAEGTPKQPLPLIQDGIAHRFVHDRRSAALAGARSTGHALRPGGAPDGPAPRNLVLAGGGAADEAELCQPIGRGVYVTRLWYTNAVRPKETLVTGVTRDGTFLIEDGEVTRPLADLRVTDSMLGLLERAQQLGARAKLTSSGEFYGRRFAHGVLCPPMRVGAMRFTG